MKIRKFNEADEVIEISNDRVTEILLILNQMNSNFQSKEKEIQSICNELLNFRSKSTTANNQIDDTTLNLEVVSTKLQEINSSLDVILESLNDYLENGPRYLYG